MTTKIQAYLIQEPRSYTASNNLLQDALYQAGFTVTSFGAKPPESTLWNEDLHGTALFLGSLLLDPLTKEQKEGKTQDEVKALEEERNGYPDQWAKLIKEAIGRGAGLVAMLDGSTVKVLVPLIEKLELDDKLQITSFDEVKGITFRPILTKDGKAHEAVGYLNDKALPPFGSTDRSYHHMLARKDGDTQVLMEIPEYIDQKPIIPPAWAKDVSPDVYQAYPFLVVRKVKDQGPGIAIMAADWCNTGGQEFVRWPHASIWLASLACAVTGLKMEELKPQTESEVPSQQIEPEEPSLKPKSAESAHWFLKEDRKHFIPNWGQIEGQLSTPIEEPTSPVMAKVQASLGPRQISEQPCAEKPDILDDGEWLKAKLCNDIVVCLDKKTMQVGYCLSRDGASEIKLPKDPVDSSHTPWFWEHETVTYQGHQLVGANLEVRCSIHENGANPPVGHLVWTFIPRTKVIEGVEWTCVGERFALTTQGRVANFTPPPHHWRLGEAVADHWSHRLACYGERPGFVQVKFDQEPILFCIGPEFAAELKDRPEAFPGVLRTQFQQQGITLGAKAKIKVEDAGSRWAIHDIDSGKRYYIQCTDQRFNVYNETTSGAFHWFYSGQPFQMLTYEGKDAARTLWCYTTTAAEVRSEARKAPDWNYVKLDLSVALGRQTDTVQLPTFWYCFAEQGFNHNLWLAAYDYVRNHFQKQFGIQRTYPRPTAMLRYNFTYLNELRHYADTFVPLAKELGFKRIDCGVHCIADLFFPLHGGIDALHYLCDKAHAAGIEVILYNGATWMYGEHPSMGFLPDAPAYHPDWFVWKREGGIRRYLEGGEYQPRDGMTRRVVRLSLRSGWYQYSLDQYAEIKKRTGVDGVWLDSWTWPNQDVNYAEPTPKPAVVEAMQYVADLQKLGYTVLVEGQSPAALESFWYRSATYAPLRGNEFCLSGMSPFASNGDGLLRLDLFRLLAYGCAMFQDIRLLADATDDVVSEVTKLARACNKMMNSIHEKLGMPLRVRELSISKGGGYHPFVPFQEPGKGAENSPVGTFWECERGIAIFGFQTVWSLDIDLGLPKADPGKIHLEQLNIRRSKSPLGLPIGPQNVQIVNVNDEPHLQGNLSAGDVVVIQAALGEESTDIFPPITQR